MKDTSERMTTLFDVYSRVLALQMEDLRNEVFEATHYGAVVSKVYYEERRIARTQVLGEIEIMIVSEAEQLSEQD